MREMSKEMPIKLDKRSLSKHVKMSVKASKEKKAEHIVVLDLRDVSSFTDYFVILTGHSTRQTQAIANQIEERLRLRQRRALHVEGYARGEWILLDYADFLVHVFLPATRAHYGLERLWHDAQLVQLEGEV